MVGIVGGVGAGLERSSANVLGALGLLGSAAQGRSGENVYVNASNGDLVLQRQDEVLLGVGPTDQIANTYNSLTGYTANGWQESYQRSVIGLTGSVNTAGSTITHVAADGSSVVYSYNAGLGVYVGNEQDGAYDTLSFNGSNSQWTWTNGKTQAKEVYDGANAGRLVSITDSNGNTLSYSYNGSGQLSSVTTANGEYTSFTYSGALLTSVVTYAHTDAAGTSALAPSTRVRYGYDGQGRLTSVTVDLTPQDNSIADGNSYTTTYGYDGASNRVNLITETDGSQLSIGYTLVGSTYQVTSLAQTAASGVVRTTTISYNTAARTTTVTDPSGQSTSLVYDAQGQLVQMVAPPATAGGSAQTYSYSYDANGNVLTLTAPSGLVTTYGYDASGNRISEVDGAGNTITRTFGSKNELLTETRYLTPAQGVNAAASPVTTRYAYDANDNLAYVISAEGDVTRFVYNAQGQQISQVKYGAGSSSSTYNVSGLSPSTSLSFASMEAWRGGLSDLSTTQRVDTAYDYRGAVRTITSYGKLLASGAPDPSASAEVSQTTYVYDQTGRLLSRQSSASGTAESYVYDGLGRLIGSTSYLGAGTSIRFNDSSSSTVITAANGLTTTNTYDLAGELISSAVSGSDIATKTTLYKYDALGRLRQVVDPTGLATYFLYDNVGRKVADVLSDGTISESVYTADNQIGARIAYATKLSAAQVASLTDGSGNPTSVTLAQVRPAASASDRWSWSIYDAAHRLVESIDPSGAASVLSYDGASRLVSSTAYATLLSSTALSSLKSSLPTSLVVPSADANNDRTVRNFYDGDGRLLASLDGEGGLTQILYDGAGRKIQTIAYAAQASASLRASGTLAQLLTSVGTSSSDIHNWYVYDQRGLLRARIDGEGDVTRYHYTALGDVDQVIKGQKLDAATLAGYMTTAPSLANLPAAPANQTLDVTAYTRNQYGQVLTEARTLSSGTETDVYNYDPLGRLLSVTTASGTSAARTTTYRYDSAGRLTGQLSGVGSAALAGLGASPSQAQINGIYSAYGVTYAYDQGDRMIAKTTPDGAGGAGNKTLYYYDQDGRLIYQIDALGEVVQYGYDTFSERSDVTAYGTRLSAGTLAGLTGGLVNAGVSSAVAAIANGALDSHSHIDFNLTGTIADTVDALGATRTFGYNAFGQKTSQVTPLLGSTTSQTTLAYDRRGLVTRQVQDAGALALATSYAYDAFGRVIQTTDPRGITSQSVYDRAGRAISTTDGLGISQSYTYDGRGNLLSASDGRGLVSTYSYSAFERSITALDPVGDNVTRTLNAYGQTASVTDPTGATTRYVYDADGHVVYQVDGLGNVRASAYTPQGQVASVTRYATPIAAATLAGWGSSVSAAQVSAALSSASSDETTAYVYDGAGRLAYRIDPNGRVSEYGYDAAGDLIHTTEYAGNIATTSSYTVAYVQGQISSLGLAANSANRTTRTVYDADQRAVFSIDAIGDVVQVSYDSAGRVVKQTRYATQYTASGDQSLATLQAWATGNASSADRVSRTLYDTSGRALYTVNAESYVTQFAYDADGRVIQQTAYADRYSVSDGTTASALSALIGTLPATAAVTSYAYDADGRLTDVTDPLGIVTHYVFNADGQATDVTVAYGTSDAVTTHTVYDNAGRAISVTKAYGTSAATTTSYAYDGAGRVISKTDGDGYVTSYTYDADGHVLTTTDALGNVTSNSYDAFGNLVKTQDPRGGAGYFYYDKLNRQVLQVDPEGYATATSYSIGDAVTSVTRYATRASNIGSASVWPTITTSSYDQTTRFMRDNLDRLVGAVDAQGFGQWFNLDAFGNRVSVMNQLGALTYYTYDKRGLKTSETLPVSSIRADGSVEAASVVNQFQYDARGNLTKTIEAAGLSEQRTTTYAYDLDDRVVQTIGDALSTTTVSGSTLATSTVSPTTTNIYDRRGNLIESDDPTGARKLYYYDGLNRKIAEVSPVGTLTTWTYDANSNAVNQTIYGDLIALPASPGGAPPAPVNSANFRQTLYTYDRDNRVLTTTIANVLTGAWNGTSWASATGSITTTNAYDADGNLVRQTNANGASVYTYYDRLNRKIGQVDQLGYMTSWTLDTEGNVLAETHFANALAPGFSTTSLPATPAPSSADRTTLFTYDYRGNRVTETRLNVASASVSGSGVLSTATANAVITYTYDGLGHVTSKTEATGDRTVFAYDNLGRQVAEIDAAITDYTGAQVQKLTLTAYDGLGDVTRQAVGNVAGDPLFTNIAANWAGLWASDGSVPTVQSTELDGGISVYRRQTTGTPAAGWAMNLQQSGPSNGIAVTAGQSIEASAYVSSTGTSKVVVWVCWYSASGGWLGASIARDNIPPGGAFGGNGLAGATFVGGFVTAPAGAVSATITVQGYSSGSGPMNVAMAEPVLRAASPGQVVSDPLFTNIAANWAGLWASDGSVPTVQSTELDGGISVYRRQTTGTPAAGWAMNLQQSGPSNGIAVTAGQSIEASAYVSSTGTSKVVVWVCWYSASGGWLGASIARDNIPPGGAFGGNGLAGATFADGFVTAPAGAVSATITVQGYSSGSGPMNVAMAVPVLRVASAGQTSLSPFTPSFSGAVRTTTYAYGAGGRLASSTDASGFTTSYAYDAAGRLTETSYTRTMSDGTTETDGQVVQYDAAGRVILESPGWFSGSTLSMGDRINLVYDAYGEVVARDMHGILEETYAYDGAGRLWRTNAGDGVVKLYGYDQAGNQTLILSSAGASLAGYGSLSAALSALAPGQTLGTAAISGIAQTFQLFDAKGQAVQTVQPFRELTAIGSAYATLATAKSYDAFGDVISSTDARGNTTTYVYNTEGQLTQTRAPLVNATAENGAVSAVNPTTNSYYDLAGRLVGSQDANGNLITRSLVAGSGYNGTTALTSAEYHPDGGVQRFGYDVFADKRTSTNELGAQESYSYDAMDRLTSQAHAQRSDGTQLIDYYSYDGLGQRLAHWNSTYGAGVKETTDYGAQGRLLKQVDFAGHVTSYSYGWNAGLVTTGLGAFGGWTKTTVNSTGLTAVDQVDYFGREVAHTDFGGYGFTYGYNTAGWLTSLKGTSSVLLQNLAYTYYNTGKLASEVDAEGNNVRWGGFSANHYTSLVGATTTYGYDANGNKVQEAYSQQVSSNWYLAQNRTWSNTVTTTSYENATTTYDSLNRLSTLSDTGYQATHPVSIAYEYDAQGNVRHVSSSYKDLVSNAITTEDDWSKYDSMNRLVLANGVFSGSRGSGSIAAGLQGAAIAYDAAGERVSASSAASSETYAYTADGYLASTSIGGVVRASDVRDALGRVTSHSEYQANGSTVAYSRQDSYNALGQTLSEQTSTLQSDGSVISATTTMDYLAFNGVSGTYTGAYQGGVVTHSHATSTKIAGGVSTAQPDQDLAYNYNTWLDTPTLSTVVFTSGSTTWTSTYAYDDNGHLISVRVADGVPHTVFYENNAAGQIFERWVGNSADAAAGPTEFYTVFDGVRRGDVGNDGAPASQLNYTSGIAQRSASPSTNLWSNGAAVSYHNFAQAYDPINAAGQGEQQAPSTYTIVAGDTLSSVAQKLWGDASLWYLLADANGANASTNLISGQTLSVPGKVSNLHDTSSTFQVYNPSEAQGPLMPTQAGPPPPPHHGGCGGFGFILMAVVAIAVTVITYGALTEGAGAMFATAGTNAVAATEAGVIAGAVGGVAGQLTGLATGTISKFDWSSVALSAIAGGVNGALPVGQFGQGPIAAALRGAEASVITQGIGVATGLQQKFDWAGVATAAVAAGVGQAVNSALDPTNAARGWQAVGNHTIAGLASGMAAAVTATALNGKDFGSNLLQQLPNVIGQTIGEAVSVKETITPPDPNYVEKLQIPVLAKPAFSAADLANLDPSVPQVSYANQVPVDQGGLAGAMAASPSVPVGGVSGSEAMGGVSNNNQVEDVVVTAGRIGPHSTYQNLSPITSFIGKDQKRHYAYQMPITVTEYNAMGARNLVNAKASFVSNSDRLSVKILRDSQGGSSTPSFFTKSGNGDWSDGRDFVEGATGIGSDGVAYHVPTVLEAQNIAATNAANENWWLAIPALLPDLAIGVIEAPAALMAIGRFGASKLNLLGMGSSAASDASAIRSVGGLEYATRLADEGEISSSGLTPRYADQVRGTEVGSSGGNIQANKAAGDAYADEVITQQLPESQDNIRTEITIQSNGPSGVKVRVDAIGQDKETGDIVITEVKGSQTAPFTPNQKTGYPEIADHGGVVRGDGKPPYVGGTEVPPTKVNVIRKPD